MRTQIRVLWKSRLMVMTLSFIISCVPLVASEQSSSAAGQNEEKMQKGISQRLLGENTDDMDCSCPGNGVAGRKVLILNLLGFNLRFIQWVICNCGVPNSQHNSVPSSDDRITCFYGLLTIFGCKVTNYFSIFS